MVEVRKFEGDAQDASGFVNRVWGEHYAAQGPLTNFQPRLLDWWLFANPLATPEYRLGAYVRGKLAGVLFAEPLRLRLGGQDVEGTYGSWLSVDPAFRGERLGQKLVEEMGARQRERGAALMLGCVGLGSVGERFWKRTEHTRVFGSLGLWLHVFDPAAVARWASSAPERAFFSLVSRLPRRRPVDLDTHGIRPYRPEDLPACMALVQQSMEQVNLGYGYTAERLAHQLQFRDVPRTLVLERNGSVRGLVNSYALQMNARGALDISLIDLLALDASVPREERKRFLRVAMRDMAARGAHCAAMVRSPCVPAGLMLGAGWVPWSGGMRIVCTLTSPDVLWPASPRVFTHLR
ncbi:GNAT family N-acetyltransferase [Myxococcus fulvus]|uniref:GNAT family N-acetyltransferase n=1 Tax=Myxococcus fulvus TaxID=33 RepID=UPI003B9B0806